MLRLYFYTYHIPRSGCRPSCLQPNWLCQSYEIVMWLLWQSFVAGDKSEVFSDQLPDAKRFLALVTTCDDYRRQPPD